VRAFALVSDCSFIAQSAARIGRGLFEMALARGWIACAEKVLRLAKMLERRAWAHKSPLRQMGSLLPDVYAKIEARRASPETLRDMGVKEVGDLLSNHRSAAAVKAEASALPSLAIEVAAQPITRTVLRVTLTLTSDFDWRDRQHGGSEPFWIWVEDTETEQLYHKELWLLSKPLHREPQTLSFTIPLTEPLPPCYFVRLAITLYLWSPRGSHFTYGLREVHTLLMAAGTVRIGARHLQPVARSRDGRALAALRPSAPFSHARTHRAAGPAPAAALGTPRRAIRVHLPVRPLQPGTRLKIAVYL
jgi:hypothetical protein